MGPEDDLDDIKDEAMQDMKNVMSRVDKSGEGVCVQASTLGSLEALLEFLKSPAVKIPVSGISIGPVHKKDVMRASVMLERKRKEFATILAFDVKVSFYMSSFIISVSDFYALLGLYLNPLLFLIPSYLQQSLLTCLSLFSFFWSLFR